MATRCYHVAIGPSPGRPGMFRTAFTKNATEPKCATHSETDAVGRADLGLRRPPSAVPVSRMDAVEGVCDTNATCRLLSW